MEQMGVGVLHVVHRVLAVLLHSQVQVKVNRVLAS